VAAFALLHVELIAAPLLDRSIPARGFSNVLHRCVGLRCVGLCVVESRAIRQHDGIVVQVGPSFIATATRIGSSNHCCSLAFLTPSRT